MIPRAEVRQLDGIVRAALHDVMRELLAPIVETPDFQKRLAVAIAARSPTPAPLAGAAPAPVKPKPSAAPKPLRNKLAEGEVKAIGRAFVETGSAAATRRRCPHPPKTTVYSVISRRSWEKLDQVPIGAEPAIPPRVAPTPTEVEPPAEPAPPAPAVSPVPKPDMPPLPAMDATVIPAAAPAPPLTAVAPSLPTPAPEPPADQATYTTTKAVREWLEKNLVLGGMGKLLASDRVAAMTHQEALQEANRRRLRLRMRPFIFIGTKVSA